MDIARLAGCFAAAAIRPFQYIPGDDVDVSHLERTDYVTYCAYNGYCNYYSVRAGGKKSVNAAWSIQSTIKIRQAGFADCIDTHQSFRGGSSPDFAICA